MCICEVKSVYWKSLYFFDNFRPLIFAFIESCLEKRKSPEKGAFVIIQIFFPKNCVSDNLTFDWILEWGTQIEMLSVFIQSNSKSVRIYFIQVDVYSFFIDNNMIHVKSSSCYKIKMNIYHLLMNCKALAI